MGNAVQEMRKLVEQMEKSKSHKGLVVDPRTSRYLSVWDFIAAVVLLYTAVITPYEVSFISSPTPGLFYTNRIVDVVFLADMTLQFFLAFPVDNGSSGSYWVSDRPTIMRSYLTGWFGFDAFTTFVSVFDILSYVSDVSGESTLERLKAARVLRVLRLGKTLRLVRSIRIFRRWELTHPQ